MDGLPGGYLACALPPSAPGSGAAAGPRAGTAPEPPGASARRLLEAIA